MNFPPSTLYRAGSFVVTTPISDEVLRILSYALDDNLDKGLKTSTFFVLYLLLINLILLIMCKINNTIKKMS